MLLALGASYDVENSRHETAADLILRKYKMLPREMQLKAFRTVIPLLPPERLQELPTRSTLTHFNWSTIETEAWDIMMAGRNYYVEIPESLKFSDIPADAKAPPHERKRKWAYRFDNARQEKYRVDLLSGEVEWLGSVERVKAAPPKLEDKWSLCFDENGYRYYQNQGTGETTWDMPDSFKSKETLQQEADAKKLAAMNELRQKKGMEPLKQLPAETADDKEDDYEYKKAGESDSEDEEKEMDLLRKQRSQEIEEAEFLKNKLKREAEEKAIATKAKKRALNAAKRKAMRAETFLTGIDTSIGATNTGGDVWGRNTYTDVVRMLQRQMHRQHRLSHAEQHRQSGLTLLSAARNSQKPGISTQLLKGLNELKGVKKLTFAKYQRLRQLALEIAEPPDRSGDLELPIRFVTCLSTRTNMKGMIVSNRGITSIANTLVGDFVMRSMNFHACGVGSEGVTAFAKTLITMKSLTNLNLSSNAIDCDGAIALAEALQHADCPLLRLSLAGNRIKKRGAVAVVTASVSVHCKLLYLSLTNNLIRPEDTAILAQIAGYSYTNHGQQRFYKRDEFAGPTPGLSYKWPFPLNPFSDDRHSWPAKSSWQPVEIRERNARLEQARKDALGDPTRALIEINKMIKHDKYTYEPFIDLNGTTRRAGAGNLPLHNMASIGDISRLPSPARADEKILKESPLSKERRLERMGLSKKGEEKEKDKDNDGKVKGKGKGKGNGKGTGKNYDDLNDSTDDYAEEENNDDDGRYSEGYSAPSRGPWKTAHASPTNSKKVKFSAAKYSALQEQDLFEVDGEGDDAGSEIGRIRNQSPQSKERAQGLGRPLVQAEMQIYF